MTNNKPYCKSCMVHHDYPLHGSVRPDTLLEHPIIRQVSRAMIDAGDLAREYADDANFEAAYIQHLRSQIYEEELRDLQRDLEAALDVARIEGIQRAANWLERRGQNIPNKANNYADLAAEMRTLKPAATR